MTPALTVGSRVWFDHGTRSGTVVRALPGQRFFVQADDDGSTLTYLSSELRSVYA